MSIFNKLKKSKEATAENIKSSIKTEEPVLGNKKIDSLPESAQIKAVKESPAKKQDVKSLISSGSDFYGVLIKPLITEKSNNLAQLNQYVFEVSKKANKIQVAKAIEVRYGIKPEKINILNNQGKVTRYGRTVGKTKDWKKAIVTLPAGQSIRIHEGV